MGEWISSICGCLELSLVHWQHWDTDAVIEMICTLCGFAMAGFDALNCFAYPVFAEALLLH